MLAFCLNKTRGGMCFHHLKGMVTISCNKTPLQKIEQVLNLLVILLCDQKIQMSFLMHKPSTMTLSCSWKGNTRYYEVIKIFALSLSLSVRVSFNQGLVMIYVVAFYRLMNLELQEKLKLMRFGYAKILRNKIF